MRTDYIYFKVPYHSILQVQMTLYINMNAYTVKITHKEMVSIIKNPYFLKNLFGDEISHL